VSLRLAAGAAVAVVVAVLAAQLGAVLIRPPLSQLFAVQVAASIVNQVVPGGVGGMAVNVPSRRRGPSGRDQKAAGILPGALIFAVLLHRHVF
jgi:hypothetical protein